MYGKIFDSMYEGTLYGHWEAIVTLQQLLVLCDSEGTIDITPQAISARTSIPLEIITKGLQILSDPDPYSRTPGEDGKRIVPLDDHRPWGWRIVNYLKYRNLKSREQKLEADRVRAAEKRKALKNNGVAVRSNSSRAVAKVAYADADASTTAGSPANALPDDFSIAWQVYPKRAGSNPRDRALKAWNARLAEGCAADDLLAGVRRYAAFISATGKTGTEYVQQAATFFGPSKGFREAWTPPGRHHGVPGELRLAV